jgi:hypothetical protein
MKRTIDLHDFINEFQAFDGRYEQLGGREGLRLLFQYLEEREVDSGEDMELDVIALCCDFACDTVEDIAESYDIELDPDADDEARADAVMSYLIDRTVVIDELSDGRILYQQF